MCLENQLNVTQEDALRAKGHLVSYGYRVIDYEEWSKTWPIKAAANPGMDGRGGSRNKDHDEAVAEKVRDFFDLGNNQKKRKVDHKQISQNLPEVIDNLYMTSSMNRKGKADPKTVMLEMARCNIIQFGKKIQAFEVFNFFFYLYSYLFFSLSLFAHLHNMYYYRCRCFNNDIQS